MQTQIHNRNEHVRMHFITLPLAMKSSTELFRSKRTNFFTLLYFIFTSISSSILFDNTIYNYHTISAHKHEHDSLLTNTIACAAVYFIYIYIYNTCHVSRRHTAYCESKTTKHQNLTPPCGVKDFLHIRC